ncbi:hypothetical protein A4A49_42246, partial [Nicotiana attenuata]
MSTGSGLNSDANCAKTVAQSGKDKEGVAIGCQTSVGQLHAGNGVSNNGELSGAKDINDKAELSLAGEENLNLAKLSHAQIGKEAVEAARGVYLQVLSMRINTQMMVTSLSIQLRDGRSTCTAIRFERRRLGSTCTYSAGQSLTSCNKVETVENHLGTNQLDAAAEGYGVLLMEKKRRRRKVSRIGLSFKSERVEREGRYSREGMSENEMGEMIGIWDICGIGGQMWLLMQNLNYERAIAGQ